MAPTTRVRLLQILCEHELAIAQERTEFSGPAGAFVLAPFAELIEAIIDEGVPIRTVVSLGWSRVNVRNSWTLYGVVPPGNLK